MEWYWGMFASLFLFSFFEQCGRISKKSACKICLVYTIIWIFLSSIRWDGILGDWQGYYMVFHEYINIESFSEIFNIDYWYFEPLYYLILRLIKYATNNYSILLLFMACIGIGVFYLASKYLNEKKDMNGKIYGLEKSTIITTFFIFWCTSCGGIYTVRTNMATAICLMSISAIEKKQKTKFILMVILASLIHFTAIIFFIAYPIYHMNLNLKKISIAVIVLMLLKVISVDRILNIVGMLGGRYAEKIDSYRNTGVIDISYLSYSGIFVTIRAMSNSLLILLIIIVLKKFVLRNARFDGLVNLYIVGVAIQAILLTYNLELARIAIYFLIIQCFIIPYLFYAVKSQIHIKFFAFLGLSAYMMVKLFSLINSAEGYANFTTIFSR